MDETNKMVELLEQTGMIDSKSRCRIAACELLSAGVIVPPCRVGNTIYSVGIFTGQVISSKVVGIHYSEDDVFLHLDSGAVASVEQQLGKTIFLTIGEAEEKLKELRKDEKNL